MSNTVFSVVFVLLGWVLNKQLHVRYAFYTISFGLMLPNSGTFIGLARQIQYLRSLPDASPFFLTTFPESIVASFALCVSGMWLAWFAAMFRKRPISITTRSSRFKLLFGLATASLMFGLIVYANEAVAANPRYQIGIFIRDVGVMVLGGLSLVLLCTTIAFTLVHESWREAPVGVGLALCGFVNVAIMTIYVGASNASPSASFVYSEAGQAGSLLMFIASFLFAFTLVMSDTEENTSPGQSNAQAQGSPPQNPNAVN
jgi:hypothetical protein